MTVLNQDEFFSPLENTKPYLKLAAEGFAGSGKTYLIAQLSILLHKIIKSEKPVVIFDTEKAAKFLRNMYQEAGIAVLVKESRSLADLKDTMTRCRNGMTDILLIDSISHVWEDFVEAYKGRKNKEYLDVSDWGILKPTWKREFSTPLVGDPVHILFTGRAGYEYEQQTNDRGKKEFVKSGIKMRVEGETAFEPDILVLMERYEEVMGEGIKVVRLAKVIKDRSTMIDGKMFENPKATDFLPAIERCLSEPIFRLSDSEKDAGVFFRSDEERKVFLRDRDIALEKLEAMLTSVFPGQSAEAKKHKVDSLSKAYGTTSWTEIKNMRPEAITAGFEKIEAYIAHLKAAAETV
jgi:hypothetical protein